MLHMPLERGPAGERLRIDDLHEHGRTPAFAGSARRSGEPAGQRPRAREP